jgi:hypothetical protein
MGGHPPTREHVAALLGRVLAQNAELTVHARQTV